MLTLPEVLETLKAHYTSEEIPGFIGIGTDELVDSLEEYIEENLENISELLEEEGLI